MSKHVIPPFARLEAAPPRRPRRWLPSRALAVAMVVVIVLVGATPARAFLSVLDPMSYAVVAEMIILIRNMVGVKRQIGNYRHQAATFLHGKLAPLSDGLAPIRDAMEKTDREVRRYLDTVDQSLLPTSEWNLPIEDCTSGGYAGGTVGFSGIRPPCVPDADTYRRPSNLGGLLMTPDQLNNLFPPSSPASPALRIDHQAREAEVADLYEENRRRVVESQAQVQTAMAFIEEWRGCREYDGSSVTLDRRPCYTRPRDGDGTDGMYQELLTIFEGIDLTQGGDATLPQLEALRTQASIARTRMQAQLTEMRVREVEERNRRRTLNAQMFALERAQRLRRLACQYLNGSTFPDGTRSRDLYYTVTGVRPLPDGSFTPGACVRKVSRSNTVSTPGINVNLSGL